MPDPKDMLSSHTSPYELSKRSGVRRVNNVPIYLICAAIVAFLAIMMWVGVNRSNQSQITSKEQNKHGDTSQLAESIAGNRTDGMIPAADLLHSLTVPIAIPDDLEKPPLPARLKEESTLKETVATDPDIARIKQQKMQLFENAVTSKTTVPFPELKTHVNNDGDKREEILQRIEDAKQRITAVQQSDPNVAFKNRLAQLQGSNSLTKTLESSNNTKDKSDRWQLDSRMEPPKTPYTLLAGFVIPATLISGINSDLPGQIIAQTSQGVYDTATGKYLLIPQGSRLVGSYTSDVAYGQSRIMVAWQRIVFPDGKTLDIGAMPGADGAGYSGLSDQANNHYLRLFGSAILMSGITAGVAISQDKNNNNVYSQPTTSSALSEALGQQLGAATAQMISKNLNISPTLEIRPGFRFNVMCIKDLVLTKPYSSFDY